MKVFQPPNSLQEVGCPMPGRTFTEIIILCEDKQQAVFATTFVKEYFNLNEHRVRIIPFEAGRGAQDQAVRLKYAGEVRAYRRRAHRMQIALVVVIDADIKTVQERKDDLDATLGEANLQKRGDNERIYIFVPKRNIETWIHFRKGETVNENDEYLRFRGNESACKPEVIDLAQQCLQRRALAEDTPDSLKDASLELRRIPRA